MDVGSPAVRVRRAVTRDAEIVWEWRNDPVTRHMSLHSDPVALDDHLRWFAASLASTQRTILIGEDTTSGDAVGMCRFDLEGEPALSAEVSINIAPERRGRGVGAALLAAAITGFLASHPDVRRLTAVIRPENTASARLFEGVGFQRVGAAGETSLYDRWVVTPPR